MPTPRALAWTGRVGGRLVLLVAVPLVALVALLAVSAAGRWSAADKVAQARTAVADLATERRLALRLANERIPAQAMAFAHDLGLAPAVVTALLGFDVEQRRADARAAVDAAVDSLRDQRRAAAVRVILAGIRERADAGDQGNARIGAAYAHLTDAFTEPGAVAAVVRNHGDAIAAESASDRALDVVAAAAEFANASNAEAQALSALLFTATPDGRRAAELTLAARNAAAMSARERFTPSTGHARAAWSSYLALAATGTVDQAMSEALGPSGLQRSLADAAPLATALITRSDAVVQVFDAAVADAAGALSASHHDAIVTFVTQVVIALLSLLFTATVVVLSARSIRDPLRRLADQAARLSAGDLDTGDLDSPDGTDGTDGHGPWGRAAPQEVRVVASGMRDLAGSLRLLSERADLLAAGSLDSVSGLPPIPGRLGASLDATVGRLTKAMRLRDDLQARLQHEASHDGLTGLPNRLAGIEALARAVARARRGSAGAAVLFLDLDGFKRANDRHGHALGDELLRTVAGRVRKTVRTGDVAARWGGDEFVVIAEPVTDVHEAVQLGERIIAAISEPMVLDGHTLRIGASIGIALWSQTGDTAGDLLHDADLALYRAKAAGRGVVEVFDQELRAEVRARAELDDALRGALAGGTQLRLDYQPVFAVDATLHGFEALARWDRPGHGPVPPSVFIPVAESSDLVVQLGRWALVEACRQLAAWSRQPATAEALAGTHVAVNMSGRHLLGPTAADDVATALQLSGLHPDRLVVEITETVLLNDLETAAEHLAAIRALGVRVAVDDFGTGYTSIGHLQRLPLDVLKIDKSLIDGLENPALERDRGLVRLLVETAHTLGLGVVAEGVELPEQLAAIDALGCDEVQGFLLSRPLPAKAVAAWVAEARSPRVGLYGAPACTASS